MNHRKDLRKRIQRCSGLAGAVPRARPPQAPPTRLPCGRSPPPALRRSRARPTARRPLGEKHRRPRRPPACKAEAWPRSSTGCSMSPGAPSRRPGSAERELGAQEGTRLALQGVRRSPAPGRFRCRPATCPRPSSLSRRRQWWGAYCTPGPGAPRAAPRPRDSPWPPPPPPRGVSTLKEPLRPRYPAAADSPGGEDAPDRLASFASFFSDCALLPPPPPHQVSYDYSSGEGRTAYSSLWRPDGVWEGAP